MTHILILIASHICAAVFGAAAMAICAMAKDDFHPDDYAAEKRRRELMR